MLYIVALVFAVQHRASALCIQVSSPSWTPVHPTVHRSVSSQSTELGPLCYTAASLWLAMQIKSTMRYLFLLVKMAIVQKSTHSKCWKGCSEKGTPWHCWWECKLVQPQWRTVWRFLKNSEIELPYDPIIPLLGIYTEETRIERDTCTPIFIAALFTIARTWRQPRCPLAEEWIRMLLYIYTMDYSLAMKNNAFESVLMR